MRHFSTAALALLLALIAVPEAAAQIYVDASNTGGTQDGQSWSTAYADLQTAISNASSASEIWVAEGVYKPTSGSDETVSFTITGAIDGVEIYGGFESGDTFSERNPGDHPTVLSGDIDDNDTVNAAGVTTAHTDISGSNSYSVLFLDGAGSGITASTILDGFTITGGQSDGSTIEGTRGGGIVCDGRGSGDSCNPRIQNVLVVGNLADGGGGMYNAGNSSGTADPTLVNVVFRGNRASVSWGGAMFNTGLSGQASPTMTNVTFTDNEAADEGGAIYNDGQSSGTAAPDITNAILWGNTAVNGGNQIANNVATPTIANSIVQGSGGSSSWDTSLGTDGGGNLDQDPLFSRSETPGGPDGGLATVDDGLVVLPGSPALDAGDNTALPTDDADLDDDSDTSERIPFDLAGTSRVQNGQVDIGAFEGSVEPQVFRVDASSTAGAPDGLTWSTAFADLQAAIDAAVKTDELWVAEGTYTPASATDSLVITGDKNGLELYGGFSGGETSRAARDPEANPTVLSGDVTGDDDSFAPNTDSDNDDSTPTQTDHIRGSNSDHVLYLDGTTGAPITANTVIDGVRITAGQANGNGTSQYGGGLYCDGRGTGNECSPLIRNVDVFGNQAVFGGGIRLSALDGGTTSPTITASFFEGNSGSAIDLISKGGGVANPNITDVTFANNYAVGDGGAINIRAFDGPGGGADTSPTMANLVFAGNSAGDGGAIHNYASTGNGFTATANLELVNAVFVENVAFSSGGGGGAIRNFSTGSNAVVTPTIVNATIVGNASATHGGGIANNVFSGTVNPTIKNTILWGNRADTNDSGFGGGDQIRNNLGASVTVDYSIVEDGNAGLANSTAFGSGTGNLKKDPLLEYAPLPAGADGVFATDDDGLHLTPGSPAVGAGDDSAISLTSDLTGTSHSGTVDIGAYEKGRDPARTIYVDAGKASGPVDGASWATADTTLQDTTSIASGALGYATGNDEIWVAEGVYTPVGADTSLTITGRRDGLKIYGGFESGDAFADRAPGDHPVVLSGDVGGDDDNKTASGVTPTAGDITGANSYHVLRLDGSTQDITNSTVIEGVTITGGQADGMGPTTRGGGLYCAGLDGACSPVLRTVVFVGNTAGRGGAVFNDAAGFTSTGAASPTIINAVFTENRAQDGGAIYNAAGGPLGAVASPTITNATFVGNTASGDGGALYNRESSGEGYTSDPNLTNVILYGNTAASGDEIFNSGSGPTPTLDYTIVEGGCPSGASCSNLVSGAPLLADTTDADGPDGTFATVDDGLNVTPGSPALDAGDNGAVPGGVTTDLTGTARRQDLDGNGTATVNLGAYEQAAPTVPKATTGSVSNLTSTSADLAGTVNPGGLATTVRVQYGRDGSFGTDSTVTAATGLTRFTDTTVSATITGLAPGTAYNYRLQASNSKGQANGTTGTVETDVAPPQVTTEAPTAVADTAATLEGLVNARGGTTRVYAALVETATGDSTALPLDTLRTNLLADRAVGLRVDTLRPSTEYRYTVAAANVADSVSGSSVTFTTGNAPPIAVSDTATTDEDTPVTVDVLANDEAAGGQLDASTVALVQPPTMGAVDTIDAATGAIMYVPDPDSNGIDRLRYEVADESGLKDTASVTLMITPVNDRPMARPDTVVVPEDEAVRAAVLANDTDVEGPLDTSLVEVVRPPETGTATPERDGRIAYTHDGSSVLSDRFDYRVADAAGRYDTTTVQVQVRTAALTARTDTGRIGPRRIGRAAGSMAVTVKNTGEVPLRGLSARMAGPAAEDFSVASSGEAGDLSVGATRTYALTFVPQALGLRTARLAVRAQRDTVQVPVRGRGVDVTVQTGTPARGQSVDVNVVVRGGFVPTGTALYARRGGASDYVSVNAGIEGEPSGSEVTVAGTIPDTLVTDRGIDYYAQLLAGADTLTVPAGGPARARQQPRHLPVAFDSLQAPPRLNVRGGQYRMLTVPGRPTGGIKAALRAHYGPYDRTEWRLLRWDETKGSGGGYREYPKMDSLRPGQGVWLVTRTGTPPVLPAGRTVPADTAQGLRLESGWNQVGSPFAFAVSWDTIRAASDLGPAAIDRPVAYRDSGYVGGQARLRPWEGYFVFSAEADTLWVPPVAADRDTTDRASGPRLFAGASRAADGGAAPKRARANGRGAHYALRVDALSGDERATVTLKLRPKANVGRDRFDVAQPPEVQPTLRLGALEPVGDRRVLHAGCARPLEQRGGHAAGQSWTLRLENTTDERRTTTLRLRADGDPPQNQRRYLLDLATEQRVAPGAELTLEAGAVRRLKVIVGTEAFAKAESEGIGLEAFENELRANYPNPFGQETTLAYTLSGERAVTIEIYDVLGRRIRTLVRGKTREAGLHRITWRGRTRYGEPAGSGVYFYRIEAGDFTETRKMVLVR